MLKYSSNFSRCKTPGEYTVFKWLSVQECTNLCAFGPDLKQGFVVFSENG